ncbi:ABC transporter ATP-binding protein [Corynebacterium guangdongense]|uniref:Multiple sugar transport system ATP-binding protein n=1 Tax=Corynebacterium guangdongense TaxID=1783348 RepID=A0ABU2A0J5_9CORY|nr:sn-glycerol-3-phosphate ABC transporter ATP-binding protein UgpC [Corynebacterium guangdongense]MDR7330163.1 multiple sugar transport system ATP-binding protein [Corynebacterium guangdongense]WJZ18721.1 Trehalose import ATP-binding protein SugC [Corynebacterium guangdongense]
MSVVVFDNATRTYPGNPHPSVDRLNLRIGDGEFLVLVGPSGSGKSTALRMLAGLEDINDGRILIGENDVTHVPPRERDIAMVFQNYALYPHMTVRENMGFALKIAGMDRAAIDERVEEAATALDLLPYLERKPKALSGGQRQRVAMGRAIVRRPRVFLMDEPLSNLDAKLRVQTRTQIARLQRELGVTTLYVTHDQTEALTMGDRIAVLKDGVLQQVATPKEMYQRPTNEFVAGFIGSPAMNLGTFTLDGRTAHLGAAHLRVPESFLAGLGASDNGTVILGFRPEALELVPDADVGTIPILVDFIEQLGSDAYLYGTLHGGGALGSGSDSNPDKAAVDSIIVRIPPLNTPEPGDVVQARVREGQLHGFAPSTGLRLPDPV